ncbi:uncharacterized protein RJT21DRAFT_14405 [Scheffersomyces amazonensis]|uniref:uncharacterized protein n=1 Tax=Scheffersomyces amazonensis TaxID=1078765 RepID=UPI00315CABF3
MSQYLITLKYNKDKFLSRTSREDRTNSLEPLLPASEDESAFSPSKIVKLHYKQNKGFLNNPNGIETPASSPIPNRSSNRRARNRTPTPTDVATSSFDNRNNSSTSVTSSPDIDTTTNSIERSSSSPVQSDTQTSSQSLLHQNSSQSETTPRKDSFYIPKKSYKQALSSLAQYSDKSTTTQSKLLNKQASDSFQHEIEQEWYEDVQIVSDRLHLLKEMYKAVQLIKKRKIAGKFDITGALASEISSNNPTTNNSPMAATPYGSDDEDVSNIIGNSSQQEEDESSSNSNTESPAPLGKRVPKKRVQFRV